MARYLRKHPKNILTALLGTAIFLVIAGVLWRTNQVQRTQRQISAARRLSDSLGDEKIALDAFNKRDFEMAVDRLSVALDRMGPNEAPQAQDAIIPKPATSSTSLMISIIYRKNPNFRHLAKKINSHCG